MDERGRHTRQEILTQPAAWTAALDVLKAKKGELASLRKGAYDQVLFTGCGSTYYLSLAAAARFQQLTARPARALPASELWLDPPACYSSGKTLLVAVSRSGETTETLAACDAFRTEARGDLLTFSCYPDRSLASLGRVNIVLESGQERSIAQTRAFTTLFLGTLALAALWAEDKARFSALDRLALSGARLLERCAPLAAELGQDPALDRFYWLGSGPRYGLAAEASLKMKEMSLSHSEPFHFLEFRHGPKSMLTPSTLVIGFRSSANASPEQAVLKEAQALGARLLAVAEDHADVALESGVDEAIRDVLYLPVAQLLAFESSLRKGLDPDRPNNLDAVVRLS